MELWLVIFGFLIAVLSVSAIVLSAQIDDQKELRRIDSQRLEAVIAHLHLYIRYHPSGYTAVSTMETK